MICPNCNSEIADGSNVCPMCGSNKLMGIAAARNGDGKKKSGKAGKKRPAYTKGSRGKKRKKGSMAPIIICAGLILILLAIVALIMTRMVDLGGPLQPAATATPAPTPEVTAAPDIIVFGAPTATPYVEIEETPIPQVEVTATPAPQNAGVRYKTLRKGDQGPEVMMLQQALSELGYLSGAADGNFGTGTFSAVKAFQNAQGLDADGIAGRNTLEKLYSLSTVTPMPQTTADPGDILNLPG